MPQHRRRAARRRFRTWASLSDRNAKTASFRSTTPRCWPRSTRCRSRAGATSRNRRAARRSDGAGLLRGVQGRRRRPPHHLDRRGRRCAGRVKALHADNRALRVENARLRGRIAALERWNIRAISGSAPSLRLCTPRSNRCARGDAGRLTFTGRPGSTAGLSDPRLGTCRS